MTPLRALLVGFGVRGRQWHRTIEPRADVLVAGIVEPTSSTDVSQPVWPTIDLALHEEAFDLAVICSPPERHVEGAIACMEAGVHAMIEKPLALSVAEGAAVERVAAETGRVAVVGQNFRYRPHELLARAVLRSGEIGNPTGVRIDSRLPRAVKRERPGWVLWDYTIHHLDLIRSRFDRPVAEVARAEVSDDGVAADLLLEDGVPVRYRHREGAPRFVYRERIRGTRGSLTLSEAGVRGPSPWRRRRATGRPGDEVLLDEVIGAIGGRPSSLSVADNLYTIALVEAVERSARERRPVRPAEIGDGLGSTQIGGPRV